MLRPLASSTLDTPFRSRKQTVTYDPTRRGVVEVGARVGVSCEVASLRPLT